MFFFQKYDLEPMLTVPAQKFKKRNASFQF